MTTNELPESRLTRRKPLEIWIFKRARRLFLLFLILLAPASFFVGRSFNELPKTLPFFGAESRQSVLELADGSHEAALLEGLEKEGVASLMTRLVNESGGGSLTDCHQQAHRIGRLGYQVLGEKAFQECNASCHSGCYHGAMESFLHEKGTTNLADEIDRLCSTFSTSFGNFECLHGVGHGVLALVGYVMPEAIRECDKLSNGFSQSSCYGGMFMENIIAAQGLGASLTGHETEWVNRTDPYFPCSAIEQKQVLQHECWMMQTSWMLTLHAYNFEKVASLCTEAPESWRGTCFASYGRDVAGHTLRDPQKILDLCDHVPQINSYYEACVGGAVNVIVDFWGPALKRQASDFCSMVPYEESKYSCYKILAGRIAGLYSESEERQQACAFFEGAYQSLCALQ